MSIYSGQLTKKEDFEGIATFFKNHVTLFDFRRIKRQKSKKRPAGGEKKRWS